VFISGRNVSDGSHGPIAGATASIFMSVKTTTALALSAIESVCKLGKTVFKFSERR
jgi:hypothetical protein